MGIYKPIAVSKIGKIEFEVFFAVKIHIEVFWVMTPCGLVADYPEIEGMLLRKISIYVPDYTVVTCSHQELA
jgi:hypothetical protein